MAHLGDADHYVYYYVNICEIYVGLVRTLIWSLKDAEALFYSENTKKYIYGVCRCFF